MDFSKLKGKIYFDRGYIDNKKAKIHVLNHSLHFASSVFEGIGVYNQKPLFLGEHISRLFKSAQLMRLKTESSKKKIENISKELCKINKIKDGYIRPIIFRSSHSMSPETKSCKSILSIAAWEWGKLFNKNYISLNISKYPKLNSKIYPTQAKSSGSYQVAVIERSKLEKTKFDDCLMLDLKGNVAETSACNIFWIKNQEVFTPLIHSSLDGITRRCIIKLCKLYDIKVSVGNYKLEKILDADYVFTTGTAAEIQVIGKINKKKFKINSDIVKFLKKKYQLIKEVAPNYISEIRKI